MTTATTAGPQCGVRANLRLGVVMWMVMAPVVGMGEMVSRLCGGVNQRDSWTHWPAS